MVVSINNHWCLVDITKQLLQWYSTLNYKFPPLVSWEPVKHIFGINYKQLACNKTNNFLWSSEVYRATPSRFWAIVLHTFSRNKLKTYVWKTWMEKMKNDCQRRLWKLIFSGHLCFFMAVCWHCINMNNSFWLETCFARPNQGSI